MDIALELGFQRRKRMPVILQSEAAECGLACIAMVSCYWGNTLSLQSLRGVAQISIKGVTLRDLIKIAERVNLRIRPLKGDVDTLRMASFPAILHWDFTHFVVLEKYNGSKATLVDPANGRRVVNATELSKHFTGVFLELNPAEGFDENAIGRLQEPITLRNSIGRVDGLRGGIINLLLAAFLLEIFALIVPFYLQWVVDKALPSSNESLLRVLGLSFCVLIVIQAGVGYVRSWMTTTLSTNFKFQWFGNVFSHLMRLPLDFFEKRHIGDIASRFSSLDAIQRTVTNQFVEAVIDGILATASLAIMFLYTPLISCVSLAGIVCYGFFRWSIQDSLQSFTAEQIIFFAKQQTFFVESIKGVQTIRLFGRTRERLTGWLNCLADQFNAELSVSRLTITYQTATRFLLNIQRIIVVWIAAHLVLRGLFTLGMVLSFLAFHEQFTQSVPALIDRIFDLKMLRLHLVRVAEVVRTKVEGDSSSRVEAFLRQPTGIKISAEKVGFRYSEFEPWVLRDVSLTVAPGECVAITGVSGGGKTTLAKILLGLLQPTEGLVRVNQSELHTFGLAAYRDLVGTVMQDDRLFSGSVSENISFFDPQPDQDFITECAKHAAIHEEIIKMPMSYYTLVSDFGTGLSGGQVQRLLLARALYKRPEVLLLDEATSHLDTRNESLVNAALKSMKITRIVIAHRPETIRSADRVIELVDGHVKKAASPEIQSLT